MSTLQFTPVLNSDVMLDILAEYARGLSNRAARQIVKDPVYQERARYVATRSFDYGRNIFEATRRFLDGDLSSGTRLYLVCSSLLSEIYRESFDIAELMTDLPSNVRAFLGSPESYEPIQMPKVDFTTEPYLDLSSEEKYFDHRIRLMLDTVSQLLLRALAVKYTTCHLTLTVRINAPIRGLAKVVMELVSGYQIVFLFGAAYPATKKTRDTLERRFYEEADKLQITEYMGEGKMFSDGRFEKDKELRRVIHAMTGGLFDFKPLYLP